MGREAVAGIDMEHTGRATARGFRQVTTRVATPFPAMESPVVIGRK